LSQDGRSVIAPVQLNEGHELGFRELLGHHNTFLQ
jgi:hypothetical protein